VDYWRQPAEDGMLSVAEVLIDVLSDARSKNGWKARLLELGIWSEAAGALLLLTSVVIVLV
jgi:hypothetical protein